MTAPLNSTALVDPLYSGVEQLRHFLVTPVPGAPVLARPLTVLQSAGAWWAIFLFLQWTGLGKPRHLKRKSHVEWDARTISTLHAIALVVGSAICFHDSFTYSREQYVTGYTFWPDLFCRIFLGYLLYDVSCIILHFKSIGEPEALVHHALFIAVSVYVLQHSIMAFPFVWLAFGELSTPFLNLRWRLAVLGQKSSRLYLANGLALLLTFFVGRVVVYGWGIAHLWSLRDVWLAKDQPALTPAVPALFVLGYVLNLYWFTLIARGTLRAFSRTKPEKVKE